MRAAELDTVHPRSLVLFYIVTYNINLVKPPWTYRKNKLSARTQISNKRTLNPFVKSFCI